MIHRNIAYPTSSNHSMVALQKEEDIQEPGSGSNKTSFVSTSEAGVQTLSNHGPIALKKEEDIEEAGDARNEDHESGLETKDGESNESTSIAVSHVGVQTSNCPSMTAMKKEDNGQQPGGATQAQESGSEGVKDEESIESTSIAVSHVGVKTSNFNGMAAMKKEENDQQPGDAADQAQESGSVGVKDEPIWSTTITSTHLGVQTPNCHGMTAIKMEENDQETGDAEKRAHGSGHGEDDSELVSPSYSLAAPLVQEARCATYVTKHVRGFLARMKVTRMRHGARSTPVVEVEEAAFAPNVNNETREDNDRAQRSGRTGIVGKDGTGSVSLSTIEDDDQNVLSYLSPFIQAPSDGDICTHSFCRKSTPKNEEERTIMDGPNLSQVNVPNYSRSHLFGDGDMSGNSNFDDYTFNKSGGSPKQSVAKDTRVDSPLKGSGSGAHGYVWDDTSVSGSSSDVMDDQNVPQPIQVGMSASNSAIYYANGTGKIFGSNEATEHGDLMYDNVISELERSLGIVDDVDQPVRDEDEENIDPNEGIRRVMNVGNGSNKNKSPPIIANKAIFHRMRHSARFSLVAEEAAFAENAPNDMREDDDRVQGSGADPTGNTTLLFAVEDNDRSGLVPEDLFRVNWFSSTDVDTDNKHSLQTSGRMSISQDGDQGECLNNANSTQLNIPVDSIGDLFGDGEMSSEGHKSSSDNEIYYETDDGTVTCLGVKPAEEREDLAEDFRINWFSPNQAPSDVDTDSKQRLQTLGRKSMCRKSMCQTSMCRDKDQGKCPNSANSTQVNIPVDSLGYLFGEEGMPDDSDFFGGNSFSKPATRNANMPMDNSASYPRKISGNCARGEEQDGASVSGSKNCIMDGQNEVPQAIQVRSEGHESSSESATFSIMDNGTVTCLGVKSAEERGGLAEDVIESATTAGNIIELETYIEKLQVSHNKSLALVRRQFSTLKEKHAASLSEKLATEDDVKCLSARLEALKGECDMAIFHKHAAEAKMKCLMEMAAMKDKHAAELSEKLQLATEDEIKCLNAQLEEMQEEIDMELVQKYAAETKTECLAEMCAMLCWIVTLFIATAWIRLILSR